MTLLEWGRKVREGYLLTEDDLRAIIPNADRFTTEGEQWEPDKKNFHDKGIEKFIGSIGMFKPQKPKENLIRQQIREKIEQEVGKKYAEEHDSKKVTSTEIMASILQNATVGKGSYLTGGTGSGKTHTMVEIMIQLATFFGGVSNIRYYYYGDLFKVLQKNEKYQKAKYIILDDLCEPPASWFEGLIETFIEDVYRSGSVLIITSNIMLEDYKVKRITSRLMALCKEYKLNEQDRRKPTWNMA